MASRKRSLINDADIYALHKEWDEASCPICMDHPHNAVLLLCSSYEKGCRSYICDTSYRHSNCLDRFKNLSIDGNTTISSTESNSMTPVQTAGSAEHNTQDIHRHSEMQEGTLQTRVSGSLLEGIPQEANVGHSFKLKSSLSCPLCRGNVLGWKVVEEARKYLNQKPRSCSRESCTFSGNYRELRLHARRLHPTARPADVDPSRQQAWRHLEHQREYADIVSAIRSAMPGAVVFGDYVIENGDRLLGGRGRAASVPGEVNAPWYSTFFLFQMIGSMNSVNEPRTGRSRAFSRHRRSTEASSRRRYLWGENLLGLRYDDDNDEDEDDSDSNVLSDMEEDTSPNPRRRRHLTHSRSDEDQ